MIAGDHKAAASPEISLFWTGTFHLERENTSICVCVRIIFSSTASLCLPKGMPVLSRCRLLVGVSKCSRRYERLPQQPPSEASQSMLGLSPPKGQTLLRAGASQWVPHGHDGQKVAVSEPPLGA